MPIYEYQCKNCGHITDELQSIKDPPLVTCPNCKKDTLARLIGTGAGLIFKGSGFYLTDYKKSTSGGNQVKPAGKKTEPKPEAKTETKQTVKEDKKTVKKESK